MCRLRICSGLQRRFFAVNYGSFFLDASSFGDFVAVAPDSSAFDSVKFCQLCVCRLNVLRSFSSNRFVSLFTVSFDFVDLVAQSSNKFYCRVGLRCWLQSWLLITNTSPVDLVQFLLFTTVNDWRSAATFRMFEQNMETSLY